MTITHFVHTVGKPVLACLFFIQLSCVYAQTAQPQAAPNPITIPAAPDVAASSFLLVDFHSGRVLGEKEADKRVAPASITKVMTAYVVFGELKNGHLQLSDKINISKNAWATGGSKMFVKVNSQVSVEDLLQGMIIQSGNDASVALAEHLAGSETAFADMMNQQAARLGMKNSHFQNATGLPAPEHYTTARDLVILARALIKDFPEYYRWDSQKEFTYNNITQPNRNLLLWRDPTVDGIKTGHTDEAGFCLLASAKREDMRLVSVVLGTASEKARASETQALLNYGFRFFETHRVYQANETLLDVRIRKGTAARVPAGFLEDAYITAPRNHFKELKIETLPEKGLIAPIKKGDKVGELKVTLGNEVVQTKPIVALNDLEVGGFFRRMYDAVSAMLED
jgi:D-alanyl-D-alanine carboxypeptidase (penicillin-binding protein 5/6)